MTFAGFKIIKIILCKFEHSGKQKIYFRRKNPNVQSDYIVYF